MGIVGLLPLLKEIQVARNIADFKGKRYVSVTRLSQPVCTRRVATSLQLDQRST